MIAGRKDSAIAELRELELAVKTGVMLDSWTTQSKIFTIMRQCRDMIQAIPDRVAGVCAAESDPAVIHTLLVKELQYALDGLARSTKEFR